MWWSLHLSHNRFLINIEQCLSALLFLFRLREQANYGISSLPPNSVAQFRPIVELSIFIQLHICICNSWTVFTFLSTQPATYLLGIRSDSIDKVNVWEYRLSWGRNSEIAFLCSFNRNKCYLVICICMTEGNLKAKAEMSIFVLNYQLGMYCTQT